MKEPWAPRLGCCCCRGPRTQARDQNDKIDIDVERAEHQAAETASPATDAGLAERAIQAALRLSFHSDRSGEKQTSDLPPPSYDTVLKDDERRTPAAPVAQRNPPGDEIEPVRQNAERDSEPGDRKVGNHESVLSSSGDSDVVLTPPTTAPPTVIDEDSEDDERFRPAGRSGR
ncbi:hypothetical protein CB0940_08193 [Cercospora beticola]|uniref:Uncharacterized protein n=1 Tax=Cercospora beticola TaxID=122368 RepID=A0A2G5HR80_CERBT|nr:hypothetical protein CB0940_08193 [Cercospora beticola]PIA94793.1 hypothetical protein CB0940_08193 [Cercospora beticola]WPB04761.1 hypothetical protein RHO25_009408 [Cercospora beticola]